MPLDLTGKRVLLLGAETDLGREIASALTEAGVRLALVGASNDAGDAFAVQRLARKLNAEVSQAIDATNDMAVRVMVRQVSKALGGLDGAVCVLGPGNSAVLDLARRHAQREFERAGVSGEFIVAGPDATPDGVAAALAAPGR
jgi:NAD(P)-dependent dehydrogenase (short-subunit alcohol dehydrogenase family)